MISGIRFEQGKIFLASLPFTNLKEIKKRPVLVISNNHYNKTGEDVIVLAITSNTKERNHTIVIDNRALDEGSLPKESRIKADHVMKLSKDIMIKELGKIGFDVLIIAIKELKKVLDPSPLHS